MKTEIKILKTTDVEQINKLDIDKTNVVAITSPNRLCGDCYACNCNCYSPIEEKIEEKYDA